MGRHMIKIQNLTKYYGKRLAVDDISFDVGKGEIVGFLGPNGAGKSTTMRMITGYLLPTRGDVWIDDHNMMTQSLEGRRLIGYLPEMVPLYLDMTTRRYLDYAARLRGVNKRLIKSRIDEVVQRCGLEEYIDEYLSKISKGFRQRVGLAQAVIHDPKVLILDEPTVGIDPIQVAHTRQLIKDLGKDRTILLSSHILSEVSMICERVVIIHEGRIVAQDRIENLGGILEGGKRLRLTVQGPASKVTDCLREIKAIRDVTYETPHHIVEFPSDQEPHSEINAAMFQNGWPLMAMEAVELSLEEIFLRLTTEKQT
jgi:ABC-2 type transport system ATP-binding protein